MIVINGKVMSGSGKNVTITNGVIKIDGKLVDGLDDEKTINIEIKGNINILDVDHCNNLKVIGNVTELETTSGDVDINGDVLQNVGTTSGDVVVRKNINGSVKTSSGDVTCKEIGGNAKTSSGDISRKFL